MKFAKFLMTPTESYLNTESYQPLLIDVGQVSAVQPRDLRGATSSVAAGREAWMRAMERHVPDANRTTDDFAINTVYPRTYIFLRSGTTYETAMRAEDVIRIVESAVGQDSSVVSL